MEVIVLDKWDSQLVLIAKGHFSKISKKLDISKQSVIKALWADRCGIRIELVNLGYVLQHSVSLLSLLNKLSEKEVCTLLYSAIENEVGTHYGLPVRGLSMLEAIVESTLAILSNLQVKDSTEVDGEVIWVDLVTLEDYTEDFLKVFIKGEIR